MTELTCDNKIRVPLSDRLELDTAATIFPIAFNDSHRALIRVTVNMSEDINISNMQLALNRLMTRFPSFYVRLNNNLFRYFFEKLDRPPIILNESEASKALFMTLDDLKKCAFRVIVGENRLALEYFHSVSDGYGGSIFLKSLLAEYLHIRYGIPIPDSPDVLIANEEISCDEIKNDYHEISGVKNKGKKVAKAYTLKGTKDKYSHITELSFKTDELLKCASEYGVTLTAFLSAVLTSAILDLQKSEKKKKKEIRLSIPIDLRKRFSSNSLRNFSLLLTLSAGDLTDTRHFSDLCKLFNEQLKENASIDKLSSMAISYVKMTQNKFITASPLFLKKWVVQILFLTSLSKTSATFSNLGIWTVPEDIRPYVQACSFVFSPKPNSPYSCALVSLDNTLTLTLTRNIKEPLLESRLSQILKSLLSAD